jgi:uncharacterized protein
MTDRFKIFPEIGKAYREGNLTRVEEIFSLYPGEIESEVPGWGTWLHYAAAHANLDIVKYLVEKGLNINKYEKNDDGNALNSACMNGNYEIAKFLVDNGAEMDTSDPIRNPLFGAVVAPSLETVKLLLERGIDSRVKYDYGSGLLMDAMGLALERGEAEIAKCIADWNSQRYDGKDFATLEREFYENYPKEFRGSNTSTASWITVTLAITPKLLT